MNESQPFTLKLKYGKMKMESKICSALSMKKEFDNMKQPSFVRSPFSRNGRYRLQIVSFGA